MRIAVLIKQVPRPDELALVDGRLNRDGVSLEVNAYCRRANAKAVELAGVDGEVVVFTMGPPSADDALREMIACGATRGVHVCDPALAGSDTLATARALSVAVFAEGPFDLVLCGLNSIDADTGQVGPELAELLGLPFVAGARRLDVVGSTAFVESESDGGSQTARVHLPAVISTAERLCDPSKADALRRQDVSPTRIERRTARELGLRFGEVGLAGSPTSVGRPRVVTTTRQRLVVDTVAEAIEVLHRRGALEPGDTHEVDAVPESSCGPVAVWCVLDPEVDRPVRELLGEGAAIAAVVGGTVTAVMARMPAEDVSTQGADRILVVPGSHAEDWGEALAVAAESAMPRIVLVEGTHAGRAVASKMAARHGWGLTGDGIEIDVDPDGSLTVWKPAVSGRLIAPIRSSSAVQLATIRPGVLKPRHPRSPRWVPVETWSGTARRSGRVELLSTTRIDEGRAELTGADVVIGVGQGVPPEDYPELEPLRRALGASIGATRKVTDRGWMPRSRQIGITGISISPRLYVSLGASGRFNHAVGFQAAGHVLAINADPSADIFHAADVGVVGDWRRVVTELEERLRQPSSTGVRA